MAAVDIVIVNWNSGGQLADCLRSLQPMYGIAPSPISKCIVVDNASSDGSADGLDALGMQVSVVRNTANHGFGAACNAGAALGSANYILFLNPDVKLSADTLPKALSFMEEKRRNEVELHSRVGMLGVQLVDEQCRVQPSAGRFPTPGSLVYQMLGLDRLWPRRFPPFVMSDWDHLQTREVDVLQGAFLLVRREAFSELDGFDERFFLYYEDVDLAYRAEQAGWMRYYFAGAQAYHRGGGATEQIRAGRLAYWLESRVLYAAKHFGVIAAIGVAIASVTLELAARIVWNVIRVPRGHLGETLRAYREYVRLPWRGRARNPRTQLS